MFEVVDIKNLKEHISYPIDAFITFCSFEDRCTSVSANLLMHQVKEKIIFHNQRMPLETAKNLECLKGQLGANTRTEAVDLMQPLILADKMLTVLREVCKPDTCHTVLIDITSFTHEALLILVALCKLLPVTHFVYAYVNAMEYAPKSENGDEQWLSRGIKEVRSVLGYAGDIKPSQDTVLIVMVGYECERAWKLIDNMSPNELIITYNDNKGSTDQKHKDASKAHAELLNDLAAYYQNPPNYVIASNDPFEAEKGLLEVIDSISKDKNIIVAPMNNKISTFGAALAALKRPRVQLCYAPAVIYNTSYYSVRGDKCYLFTIESDDI